MQSGIFAPAKGQTASDEKRKLRISTFPLGHMYHEHAKMEMRRDTRMQWIARACVHGHFDSELSSVMHTSARLLDGRRSSSPLASLSSFSASHQTAA